MKMDKGDWGGGVLPALRLGPFCKRRQEPWVSPTAASVYTLTVGPQTRGPLSWVLCQ